MPKYKYKRDDVIRKGELDSIFDKIGSIKYMGLSGDAWQCLVAILWLFGKRISEVIRLKSADLLIYNDDETNQLIVRFLVLKKESLKDTGVLRLYTKRITLDNPYTKYIMNYMESFTINQWNAMIDKWKDTEAFNDPNAAYSDFLDDEIDFLFPRKQCKTGHIFREYAWHVLKMVKPDISSHLFRHSLATQMAEEGATAYEMVNWFDWERTDTALEYIRRSGRLTERLSSRVW